MYTTLRIKNSSPIIIKDAKKQQYLEAFLIKNKALDGTLHLQEHKLKPLSLYALALYLKVLL